jgi:hypothetical protein
MTEDLQKARRDAAQAELDEYDFGANVLEEASGWTCQEPSVVLERLVYLLADGELASYEARFVVCFAMTDSVDVVDVYATRAVRGPRPGTESLSFQRIGKRGVVVPSAGEPHLLDKRGPADYSLDVRRQLIFNCTPRPPAVDRLLVTPGRKVALVNLHTGEATRFDEPPYVPLMALPAALDALREIFEGMSPRAAAYRVYVAEPKLTEQGAHLVTTYDYRTQHFGAEALREQIASLAQRLADLAGSEGTS